MATPIIILACGGAMLLYSANRWSKAFVVLLVLALQFLWFAWPVVGHGPSYRKFERYEARRAWLEHPSPTTKNALDEEERRLSHHEEMTAISTVAFVLILDGVGIYYFWTYGRKEISAQQA